MSKIDEREAQIAAGKRIKELRERQNMTKTELSKRSNVSCSSLCNYESGAKTMGIDNFVKIAEGLGVSLDELFYGNKTKADISSPDLGEKIANCFYELHKENVLIAVEDRYDGITSVEINNYIGPVNKLLKTLDTARNFSEKEEYEKYMQQAKNIAAMEINKEHALIEESKNRHFHQEYPIEYQ